MKATLRASRSNLAIRSVAFPFRAASNASANSGRSERLPVDLDEGRNNGPTVLAREGPDGGALRLQPKAALALANGADPEIGDESGRSLSHGEQSLHSEMDT